MAGIRTKKQDNWLPSRVYRGKSAYEWHPKGGGCIKLCALTSSKAQVWTAFEQVQKERDGRPQHTVGDLAKAYFKSRRFLHLAPRTQGDYEECWGVAKKVFEKVDAHKVLQKHIRAYMDERGKSAPVRANRERVVLKNIYAHAYEYSVVKFNPCEGVRNFPEPGRDFYIEDDEYNQFLDDSSEIIQLFMELSYLNATRGQDVRLIRIPDLREIGIYIKQQKTGKKQIKEWSERLQQVVDRALARRAKILTKIKIESPYLLPSRTGNPYTAEGLKTTWAKNRIAVEEKIGRRIEFTYHDIKAKGISDYDGDKQKFSGHKNRGQMEKYNRKADVVSSLNVPIRAGDVRK